jgi:hypothetical protein
VLDPCRNGFVLSRSHTLIDELGPTVGRSAFRHLAKAVGCADTVLSLFLLGHGQDGPVSQTDAACKSKLVHRPNTMTYA